MGLPTRKPSPFIIIAGMGRDSSPDLLCNRQARYHLVTSRPVSIWIENRTKQISQTTEKTEVQTHNFLLLIRIHGSELQI